jgi:PBP1b-binding outer membrane lipoprotein LpoB
LGLFASINRLARLLALLVLLVGCVSCHHLAQQATQREPIDAPCTQCLRHGDLINAKKALTASAPAATHLPVHATGIC